MENLSHQRKISSDLEGHDCFFHKILSRDSSVGYSSRTLYYRRPEGVPFKWETQPGTPKEPPKEEILPPLSPPPAVLSLGFPKPCINVNKPPRASIRSKLMFWKHGQKNQGSNSNNNNNNNNNKKKVQAANNEIFLYNFVGSDQFYSSDGDEDFMASSSSSSSSSSLSFSNVLSSHSSRLPSPARESLDRPHHHHLHLPGCSPLNLSSVLVLVTKR